MKKEEWEEIERAEAELCHSHAFEEACSSDMSYAERMIAKEFWNKAVEAIAEALTEDAELIREFLAW